MTEKPPFHEQAAASRQVCGHIVIPSARSLRRFNDCGFRICRKSGSTRPMGDLRGGFAMDCDALRDDQWDRLKGFVPGGTKGKRGPRTDNRKFLNALLW